METKQEGLEDLPKKVNKAVVLEVHWHLPQHLVSRQQDLERQRYGQQEEMDVKELEWHTEQQQTREYLFLKELAQFEQEIRKRERKEWERQEAIIRKRKEDNQDRWRNLHYITLNQRISKPWVSSYFGNIPTRIYCQPMVKGRKGQN